MLRILRKLWKRQEAGEDTGVLIVRPEGTSRRDFLRAMGVTTTTVCLAGGATTALWKPERKLVTDAAALNGFTVAGDSVRGAFSSGKIHPGQWYVLVDPKNMHPANAATGRIRRLDELDLLDRALGRLNGSPVGSVADLLEALENSKIPIDTVARMADTPFPAYTGQKVGLRV